jgi:hypothetical protein
MGYKVLGLTEELFKGYSKIPGLEGPMLKGCNRVVYYDPQEGKYYDPKTDFYLEQDEVDYLDNQLLKMLAR